MGLGAIQGKLAVFSVYDGTTYQPFLCASDISVETSTELTPTRTKGRGYWKSYAGQSLGYKINLDGIFKIKDSEINGSYFLELQLQFLPYKWKILFTDEDGEVSTLSGEALVESSVISIGVGKVVESNFSFVGNGELKHYLGLEPCDVAITSASYDFGGFTHHVTVHATVEGMMDHIVYTVDGGVEHITPGGEVIDVACGTSGIHSVTLIPVCTNGQRGTPYTISVVAF